MVIKEILIGTRKAIEDENKKREIGPGPKYVYDDSKVLTKAPEFSMGTTAIREYEEKVVNQAKSPGPVYKPNYKVPYVF